MLTSWQPTAAADGCVGNVLKLIRMRERVMQALAKFSSADVFLATRHRGMWWQLLSFDITSGVGSSQPVPVPPGGGGGRGAQSEVVIESDSSAGSDANWELRPLNWESRNDLKKELGAAQKEALREVTGELLKRWNAGLNSFVSDLIVGLSCAIMSSFLRSWAIEVEIGSSAVTGVARQSCQRRPACEECNLPITGDIWKPAQQDFWTEQRVIILLQSPGGSCTGNTAFVIVTGRQSLTFITNVIAQKM